jgi:hypothetical protein
LIIKTSHVVATLIGLVGCGAAQLTPAEATTALELAVCIENAVQKESQQRQARAQQLLASPDVGATHVQPELLHDATKIDATNPYRAPSSVGHEVEQMMRARDAGAM